MRNIGEHRGSQIYWSDPAEDGGNGTGEVMAGSDLVGTADTEDEAFRMAEHHIDDYIGRIDNMTPVDD